MLPQPLIIEFWLAVRDIAQDQHGLKRNEVNRAIRDYLALAEKHQFTDAIYHRNAEEVAEIVAHGAKLGFREPVMSGAMPRSNKKKKFGRKSD